MSAERVAVEIFTAAVETAPKAAVRIRRGPVPVAVCLAWRARRSESQIHTVLTGTWGFPPGRERGNGELIHQMNTAGFIGYR